MFFWGSRLSQRWLLDFELKLGEPQYYSGCRKSVKPIDEVGCFKMAFSLANVFLSFGSLVCEYLGTMHSNVIRYFLSMLLKF